MAETEGAIVRVDRGIPAYKFCDAYNNADSFDFIVVGVGKKDRSGFPWRGDLWAVDMLALPKQNATVECRQHAPP
jgi:hypothetical protein